MKPVLVISAILVFFNACSSSEEPAATKNSANSVAANTNSANVNSPTASNSNPTVVLYNGMQNVDPNAFNASTSNLKEIKIEPKRGELPPGSRPAPDNSIFSSTMNAKGQPVETRVFKSHPVLAKVEKTFINAKDFKYKVYLRDGKVVEAPADKMNNFAALAPGNILEAIGMLPKPPSNPPTNKEDKKEEKKP